MHDCLACQMVEVMFRSKDRSCPFTGSVDDLPHFFTANISGSHDPGDSRSHLVVGGDKTTIFGLQWSQGQHLTVGDHPDEDKNTVNDQS